MGLDGGGRALERDAFNDIGVKGSLEEPLDLSAGSVLGFGFDLLGLLLEHIDESTTDELALLLGVRDALEPVQEELGRINNRQVDAQVLGQSLVDRLAFLPAHAPVVDQDSMEAVADRLLHQLRSPGTN